MKITKAEIFRYRLPLVQAFVVAGNQVVERSGFAICLRGEDGKSGWGDIAPLPGFSQESHEDARENAEELLPKWAGVELPASLDALEPIENLLQGAFPSVRFAFESACLHLMAAAAGLPLSKLLASGAASTISINALLAGSPHELAIQAVYARDSGYRTAKIKVGRGTVDEDVARVKKVWEVTGPSVAIRLDANRAWSLDQCRQFAGQLDGLPVEYVEEPLARPVDLASFHAVTGLPLGLDETVDDTPVSVWESYAGVAALVLKPTLLGLFRTLRLGRRAAERGIKPVISASFESGVGLATLVQLAAALCGPDTAAGLDTYRWLHADVLATRLPFEGGTVAVEQGPGFAWSLDTSKLSPVRHG